MEELRGLLNFSMTNFMGYWISSMWRRSFHIVLPLKELLFALGSWFRYPAKSGLRTPKGRLFGTPVI